MYSIIKIKKLLHNSNYYLRIYISFKKKPKIFGKGYQLVMNLMQLNINFFYE